jgi:hypothetical protein
MTQITKLKFMLHMYEYKPFPTSKSYGSSPTQVSTLSWYFLGTPVLRLWLSWTPLAFAMKVSLQKYQIFNYSLLSLSNIIVNFY